MSRRPSALHAATVVFTLALGAALTGLNSAKEPAVGRIHGTVTAQETGTLIPEAQITLMPGAEPGNGPWEVYNATTDAHGAFAMARIPVGVYRVSASSRAHELKKTVVSVEEGQLGNLKLEMAPVPEYLNLDIHQPVYLPGEKCHVLARGFAKADALELTCFRVDYEALAQRTGVYYGSLAEAIIEGKADAKGLPHEKLSTSRVAIEGRDAEGVFSHYIPIPVKEPGYYVFGVRVGAAKASGAVLISRVGLISKRVGNRLVVFATDLETGAPQPGTAIRVYRQGASIAKGATDSRGLFEARLPAEGGEGETSVFGRHGDHVALLSGYYWQGSGDDEQYRMYAYTDRPIYRPGQTVHFKAILRQRQGVDYRVPSGTAVSVRVSDWRDTTVYSKQLRANRYGSIHDTISLSPYALTGDYLLRAQVGGQELTSTFAVASYRKPEYRVEIAPGQKRYTRGDEATVTVRADYYFGAPVVGARVSYSVLRAPHWTPSEEEQEWAELYGADFESEYHGDCIKTGTARLDENGEAIIRVATAQDKRDPEDESSPHEFEGDSKLTVLATVTDASGFSAEGDGSFTVTRGEFMVRAEPDSWAVAPGQAANVRLTTQDYEGLPVGSVPVEVTLTRETWHEGHATSQEESKQQVTTDAKGQARASVTPGAEGSYEVRCVAIDGRGNRIVTTQFIWVTGSDSAELAYRYPKIEIIPDKKVYQPGDTARLIVNVDQPSACALFSIEGERLSELRQVSLAKKTTVLSVPITRQHIPNIYVAVCYVAGKEFVSETKPLRVSPPHKSVRVAISSDKPRYLPGDQATFEVTTTDSVGKPVAAEVSLGVVDESIYAIREEPGPDILRFFYDRQENRVDTSYSFPRVYLNPGEKSGTLVATRKYFPDTAFWRPALMTDSAGKARVTLKVPDTLTTWRATARAQTLSTAVGQATHQVIASRPLMARLEMPRFLRQNDEVTLRGIVHNESGREQQVAAELLLKGLETGAQAKQQARIPSAASHVFEWLVRAPLFGNPLTTLKAVGTQDSDAMELGIPVLPHGVPRIVGDSGSTDGSVTVQLDSAPNRVDGSTTLALRLTPSLFGTIFGSLEYLAAYPWGCTEQTMSAFLPDVVLARALRELDLEAPTLEKKLPDMVAKGLARLYDHQQSEGGWGWGRYGEGDTWMTAYVLFGLRQAQQAGYSVNPTVIDSGLSVLRTRVPDDLNRGIDAAFGVYVLALYDALDDRTTRWLNAKAERPAEGTASRAYVALALWETSREEAAREQLERVIAEARRSGGLCYWTHESSRDTGYYFSETEATAGPLAALTTIEPSSPVIPEVLRWYMARRVGAHWESTRDTALVLCSMIRHAAHTRELSADYSYVVRLNGNEIAKGHMGVEDVQTAERVLRLDAGQIGPGPNRVEIAKEGDGRLYYSVELSEHVMLEEGAVLATDSGIRATRTFHSLRPTYDPQSDTIGLKASPKAATRFRAGDAIEVQLNIQSPAERAYVLIEEPVPAGCEIGEIESPDPWMWHHWWGDVDVRDDKIAFYAPLLPKGESTVTYKLRAALPGRFHTMPTHVWAMYRPAEHGWGSEQVIEIGE